MARVLVTDGFWRKSLSAVRSLGRAGHEVTVSGESRLTTTFFSKYCSTKLILPNPGERPEQFYQALKGELQQRHYDLLIPMEDETIKVILPYRAEIERLTRLPLPVTKSFAIANDKAQTLKLAEELGVPCPKTVFPTTLAEVQKLAPTLMYPVVVKPAQSSGSRGLRYAASSTELVNIYKKLTSAFQDLLIQERIPQEGTGMGVGLLFNKHHEAVAGFAYKRLREYPVSGGPSTLRESVHNPELIQTAIRLLQRLRWYGVAMVEFKLDVRDNQLKLIEINPRFWGSLELANVSGINFPDLLTRIALDQRVAATFSYRVGVRCRWLIPGDILHFLTNAKRFQMKPTFFDFWAKDTYYDEFSWDDVGGTLGTIVVTIAAVFSPKMWRIAITR